MTTYLTNGIQIEMLPRVFYDDYNRPTRNSIVNADDRPFLGDRIILRDFDGDFQSECVVVKISTMDGAPTSLFIELEQVGPIEYLDELQHIRP